MTVFSYVLLPDVKVGRYAINLSRNTSHSAKTFFSLDGRKFYPHITLSDINTKSRSTKKMKHNLVKFANEFKPFNVTFLSFEDGQRWFALKCIKDRKIGEFQKSALKYLGRGSNATNPYDPHLTITRFRKAQDVKIGYRVCKFRRISFTAKTIALCSKARHGTVTKIIMKCDLVGN